MELGLWIFKMLLLAAGAIGVILCLLRWIRLEQKLRRNGRAEVETCGAVVFAKDGVPGYLPQGRASSSVYSVTFHTDTGRALTLDLSYDDFYIIREGTHGVLTWQGQRFWKFVPDRVSGSG